MSKQGIAVVALLAFALTGSAAALAQPESQESRDEALQREQELERAEVERQRALVEQVQREQELQQEELRREQELQQEELRRERELQRAEAERERELLAQEVQRERELQRAERELQQEEVRRARAEMEQARRDLEQAARTIATQVQVLPNLEQLENLGSFEGQFGYQFLRNFGNQARIGASVVDAEQGALVTQVTSGSGAETAGLKVGDIIQSVNGTAVSTAEHPALELREQIGSVEPGETVTLVVERAGRTLDLDVETEPGFGAFVGQAPGGFYVGSRGRSDDAPSVYTTVPGTRFFRYGFGSSPWSDIELVTMSETLGRYFDTSEGLLVLRAPEDDAIEIEDGDVILSISGRTPNSPEHAIRILSSFESGETIELSIMRNGRRETIEYVVPEQNAAFWQGWVSPPAAAAPAATPAPPAQPVPTPN